jgi:hypothetical protein
MSEVGNQDTSSSVDRSAGKQIQTMAADPSYAAGIKSFDAAYYKPYYDAGWTGQQITDYLRNLPPDQAQKQQANYNAAALQHFSPDSGFSKFIGALDLAILGTVLGGAAFGPALGTGATTATTTGAETAGLAASEALPLVASELPAITVTGSTLPAITGSALAGAGAGSVAGLAAGELPAITSTASTLPSVSGSALTGAGAGGVAGGLYDIGSLQANINPPDPINTGSAPKPNYNSDLSQYTPSNMTSRYLMANGWNPTAANIAGSSVQGGLVSTARGQDPLMGMLYGGAGGAIGAGINATGLPAYVSNALNGGAWGNAAGSAVRGTLQGGLMGGIFNNGNFGQGALHGLEGSVAGSAGRAVNNALDGGWLGNTVGGAVGGGLNSIFRGTPIGQGVGLGVLSNDLGYGLHQAAPYLRGLVPNRVANAFNG